MKRALLATIAGLALATMIVGDAAPAWARAGSGGSRGSRSYSAPRPSVPSQPTTPSSPSRSYTPPPPAPVAPQRPSFFGGFLGGLAGFALGGLIGSMLFGGLGRGFGIGLLDIVLIGAAILLLVSFLKRRREASTEPAYATAGPGATGWDVERSSAATMPPETVPAGGASAEAEADRLDLDRGIAHIRQMDPAFDPEVLAETARVVFSEVQQALGRGDVGSVRDRLAPEMQAVLQAQIDRLHSARRTNRVERIVVRRAEVSEAWQESGQDWATVALRASMLDYVVDDATGRVVEGSNTAPVDVEEYWTFTRPVGDKPWRLSAIQTP